MHEQPEPTPEDEERAPDEQEEHEAMRGPVHEDPPDASEVHER